MYNSQTLGVYVCFLLLFPLYYSSPLVSCSFSPSVISSVSWFFSLVYFVPLRLLTSLPFCCLRPGSLSQWAIFNDDSIPRMHLEESKTGRGKFNCRGMSKNEQVCPCIWGARDKDASRRKELITYKLKTKKKGKRLCNNFFLFFSVLPTPIKSCPSPLNAPVAH